VRAQRRTPRADGSQRAAKIAKITKIAKSVERTYERDTTPESSMKIGVRGRSRSKALFTTSPAVSLSRGCARSAARLAPLSLSLSLSLSVRAQRRTLAPGARKAVQPHARKYVEVSRPWHDQITISE